MFIKNHTLDTKDKMIITHKINKHQQGSKNSMYGKVWINRLDENKIIQQSDIQNYLNDGWIKGRKINYGFKDIKCPTCSNIFKVPGNAKKDKVCEECNSKKHEQTCERCGITFYKYIRKGRKCTCDKCKRIVVRNKKNIDNVSLMDLSKRTISKIINRSGVGCSICGWKEAALDIHHIIYRKNGGTNDMKNLSLLCPNHHRMIHSNVLDSSNLKTIDETLSNWKDFYHN